MQNKMHTKVNRISSIDGLRGIAALLVVLYHFTMRYNEIYGHIKADYSINIWFGDRGVLIFFILSGFFTLFTMDRKESIKVIIKKRIYRLYPMYWIAILITTICVYMFGLSGREVNMFDTIINLTMLQGLMGIPNVDGAYWTLLYELMFYIWIIILIYTRKIENINIICTLWMLVGSLWSFVIHLYPTTVSLFINKVFCFQFIHLFIIGMMLFKLTQNKDIHTIFNIGLCLVYDTILGNKNMIILVIIISTILYVLNVREIKILTWKPLIFISNISYCLYLVHQNIGYIIIRYMEHIGMNDEVYLFIPILIVISIATALHYLVEIPISNKLRLRLYKYYNVIS